METVTNSAPAGPASIDSASVDRAEIARFDAIAAEWWDPNGKFFPLHKLGPARLRFVRDSLCRHFGRAPTAPRPLHDLRILDVGCGGGLIAEPLTRMGASVTGIDAGVEVVAIARRHAAEGGLSIDYRVETVERIAATERFDAVLALEIVEHVADVNAFVAACVQTVGPGGALILSTLNRTLKSLLLGKIAAEYVLRWLPPGTHDWNRFLSPREVERHLVAHGMRTRETAGLSYDLLTDEWVLSKDTDVNYLLTAARHDG